MLKLPQIQKTIQMLTKSLYLILAVTSLLICSCSKTLPESDNKTFGTPSEVTVSQVKGYIQISFNGPAKPYERILDVETVVSGVVVRTLVNVPNGAENAFGGYWANGVLSRWGIKGFDRVVY